MLFLIGGDMKLQILRPNTKLEIKVRIDVQDIESMLIKDIGQRYL
jgi:hypothetical protein